MRRLVAILDMSGEDYVVWTNRSIFKDRHIWFDEVKQTRPLNLRDDDIIIWDERSINIDDVGFATEWEIIARKIERIFEQYENSRAVRE